MFPEYSVSKLVMVTPDIVYYDSANPSPMFDLIVATQTMEHLEIVLNF